MKLERKNSSEYFTTNKRNFKAIAINLSVIADCFNFVWNMVFGAGHHRNQRSGGQQERKKGELFANTFQGKLAGFVIYNALLLNEDWSFDFFPEELEKL